ncbi:MAG: DnaB-like helicase N-terminal domain-containing protein, partial [Bryobacteraceae bacterium]
MATDFWESADAALMERGLPDNILAERLVLGGILLDGERFGLVRDILTADDFAIEKHRKIWRRM